VRVTRGFSFFITSALLVSCTALLDQELLELLGDSVGPSTVSEDAPLLSSTPARAAAATGKLARLEDQGSLMEMLRSSRPDDLGFNRRALAVDSVGASLFVGGQFTSVLSSPAGGLAVLNPSGLSVGGFGEFNGPVHVIRRALDNNYWVAGSFTTYGGKAVVANLVKLRPDGQLLPEWSAGPKSVGFDGPLRALLETPRGLWVGGAFSEFSGTPRGALVLVRSDRPELVSEFVERGVAELDGEVWDLSEDKKNPGRVFVSGDFTRSNQSLNHGHLMRIFESGQWDSSFELRDGPFNSTVTQVLSFTDGTLIAGGLFTAQGKRPNLGRIVRLREDGSGDPNFRTTPDALSGFNSDVLVLEDDLEGGFFAGGLFTLYNGKGVRRLVRLRKDGRVESSFFPGTLGFDGAVHQVLLSLDRRSLFVGGQFSKFDGLDEVNGLVKLKSDGSVDPQFVKQSGFSDSSGTPQILALELDPQGRVWVGGRFRRAGGIPSVGRLVELDGKKLVLKEPLLFSSAKAGFDSSVLSLAANADGRVAVGGTFSTVAGERRESLAVMDSKSRQLDPSFKPAVKGSVHSVQWDSQGRVLLTGTFSSVDDAPADRVARLSGDGRLDSSFRVTRGPRGTPWAIAEWMDSVFVGGQFASWDGNLRVQNLARLSQDGKLASSWSFLSDGEVRSLKASEQGLYVAGAFRNVGGRSFPGIVRLSANGRVDERFRPGFVLERTELVRAITLAPRELFVLTSSNRIHRLDFQGRRLSFNSLAVSGDFLSIDWVGESGPLVLVGDFDRVGALPRSGFVALNPQTAEVLGSPSDSAQSKSRE
jgi:hypothetical protein